MNKLLPLALTIAFSTIAYSTITYANEAAQAESVFQSLDSNLDGIISLTEIPDEETLKLAFAALDLNENGELTEEEYNKFNSIYK